MWSATFVSRPHLLGKMKPGWIVAGIPMPSRRVDRRLGMARLLSVRQLLFKAFNGRILHTIRHLLIGLDIRNLLVDLRFRKFRLRLEPGRVARSTAPGEHRHQRDDHERNTKSCSKYVHGAISYGVPGHVFQYCSQLKPGM